MGMGLGNIYTTVLNLGLGAVIFSVPLDADDLMDENNTNML